MENNKVGVGVGIMLLKEGKVLLGQRHPDPEKADSELHGEGTWTMPGGKLHFGESFEEAAIRETEEETGIKLNKVKVMCVNNDKVNDAHFTTIGLISETDREPEVKEPDEIIEWRWFSIDELPSPLFFPSQKILKNYKLNEFYIYHDN